MRVGVYVCVIVIVSVCACVGVCVCVGVVVGVGVVCCVWVVWALVYGKLSESNAIMQVLLKLFFVGSKGQNVVIYIDSCDLHMENISCNRIKLKLRKALQSWTLPTR